MVLLRRVALLAVFMACLSGQVFGADDVDLNGTWLDGELQFKIVQDGNKVKGQVPKGWPEAEEPPGYTSFSGTLAKRQLKGTILIVNLNKTPDIATKKARCGKQWKENVPMTLTLSADGTRLEGQWQNPKRNELTCEASGNQTWESLTFVRKSPPPPPKMEPKPVAPVAPVEPPKVDVPPPEPPKVEMPEPLPEPKGKGGLIGGLVMLVLSAVFFFIRNAYVNYLVGSLKRSPNNAGLAGWAMFGGFVFASAIGSLALANSDWMTMPVLGGLGALSVLCFGLCAVTSSKQ